jgi:hypothetical protein
VREPVSLQALLPWATELADGRGGTLSPDGVVVSEYESAVRHNGIPEEILRGLDSVDPARLPPLLRAPGVAVRDGRMKYVAVDGGPDSLFDLDEDPGEERDLLIINPGLGTSFAGHVEAWRNRRAARPDYAAGETAEGEIAEHLSMLGYIE